MKRPRMDVNLEELDQIIDRGTHAPLSESEGEKLKGALHALAGMLTKPRTHGKDQRGAGAAGSPARAKTLACSNRVTGATALDPTRARRKLRFRIPACTPAIPARAAGKAKSIRRKSPRRWCASWDKLRWQPRCMSWIVCAAICAAKCSRAEEPEGIGPEKYDETTAAMIALLKYGSGMPFYRLEKLEHLLGIPLPASTQWEIVEEAAEVIKAARDELIRQAAQGEVLHNDDTSMRVLRLAREPSDERTGVFTSGIVSTQEGRRIALYFTGRQHAGENLRDVLQHRTADLARPLQMCDALSRNTPKLTDGAEILLAHCLAHGRRQFVEVAANFPEPCRYVLETLGDVYRYDAEARARRLSPLGAPRLSSATQRPGDGATASSGWKRSSRSRKWSRTRAWAKPSPIYYVTGKG